ncbi:MAG: ribosomal protein S18-alanine N-acetyltransferase [Clostridiales bacterium]|nr:ribosomal protein S18-alanine N-acetyltransferase [Clostridiales bacterium]
MVMIRRMREKDLEAVAELEKICFSESWSWNLLESGLHSPYDEYYVFEQNGELLGYCNLRVLAGEGEIERICVRPGSRRLGVGRKLMEEMERSACGQGVVRMMLEVREGNEAARRLYESFGFGAIAVRKNYYHDPLEDAVIMAKG